MNSKMAHVLLADDDEADCFLFAKAIEELPLAVNLVIVNDGKELMRLLAKKNFENPSVLFLDLNMPSKNGFECLTQIRQDEKLKHLLVIIYSTSLEPKMVYQLHKIGAKHYIKKPTDFFKIKRVIYNTLVDTIFSSPVSDEFSIQF